MRKVLFALLLSLLIVPSVHAEDQFFILNNFSAGLTSHKTGSLIDTGEAQESLNVRFNEDYGALAKRQKRLVLSACHASPVKSLYRYYKSDSTKYTISTSSSYIDYINSAGTCQSIYESGTDGRRWSFTTYKDNVIAMNGVNMAKKWDGEVQIDNADGSRTDGDLVADLGAPFAELDTGTDLDASSWYQYKVAFLVSGSYYYSDARSNPIETDASIYNIALTDIPLGPAGTSARYIYRTEGQASRAAVVADTTFYLIDTLSDNSTMIYADSESDATISSDAAPTWSTASGGINATVPYGKYIAINNERLFIGNDPSGVFYGKSTVYWSDILNPDFFVQDVDYELIRPDDGDEITFLKNLLGILTVGKTRTISKFYTEGASTNWTVSNPFSFMGCVSPWAAVNGINGIIYPGRYGLYNFDGQNSSLVSDVVTDKMRNILETNQDEVTGIYHDNSYFMAYTSADSGAANNDKVLILDITRNAYTEDDSHVDSFANYDSGDDYGILYSGSSEIDGSIYASGETFSGLIYRYKSQFDSGTSDETAIGGGEDFPTVTLGSNDTWAMSGSETWGGSGVKTWLLDELTGSWTSPVINVSAGSLDKLFWNEDLAVTGDITFQIRSGDTIGATESASWSDSFSDPSGSDLSGETPNNYLQFRANLSSGLYTETPSLFKSDAFLVKLSYRKSGEEIEPSFFSLWKGGEENFGNAYAKILKEIQIYYEGTEGTLTVTLENELGVKDSFDIDLSVDPTNNNTDSYFGTSSDKIYAYIPNIIDGLPTGRFWTIKYSDDGTEQWKVTKGIVRLETLNYSTFQRDL